MPLSPTGSTKSFKGPMDFDRSERERRIINTHPPSASTPASVTTPSPSSAQREFLPAEDEVMSVTQADHHPTPWDLYEKPAPPSPSSPSQAKLRVTFTSAPQESVLSPSAPSSSPFSPTKSPPADVQDAFSPSSALHLTTMPAASSTSNGFSPSPVSPGSTGSSSNNNNGHPSIHGPNSATTPPSAIRSPGGAGGFFASFRPSSPRIITTPAKEDQSQASERRRDKERTSSSGEKSGGEQASPRIARERGLDTRSRRPSSVFDHVGSVFERFSKKVHSRAESREGIKANAVSSSSATLPPTEESNSSLKDHVEYLASPSQHPGLQRNYSASSAISARSTDDFAVLSRRPVLERTLIQVTEDNERFAVVDVSGLNSAAGIKERMLSKLHRFDEEPESFSLYRTEIGLSDPSDPELGDDRLLSICLHQGDDKGTLKFLLKQTTPSSQPSRVAPPPSSVTSRILQDPPVSPRAPALVLSPSEASSSFVPTAGAAHAKSESLSSMSSISDALMNADSALAYDSGSEAGRKRVLSRSRAVDKGARRSRGSLGAEDNRLSLTSSSSSSRPTSGLLAVHEQSSSSTATQSDINDGTWRSGDTIRPFDQGKPDDDARSSSTSTAPTSAPIEAEREIEELTSEETQHMQQNGLRNKFQRRRSQRPATSSGALSSEHTQAPPSLSLPSSRDQDHSRQRAPSISSIPESDAEVDVPQTRPRTGSVPTRKVTSGSENDVPKSLQPGGGEQRLYDANDAARMYNQPEGDQHLRVTSDDILGRSASLEKSSRLSPMRSMDELGTWHRRDGLSVEASHTRQQAIDPIIFPVDSRADGRYPTMATVRGEVSSPTPTNNGPPLAHLKPRQGSFDTAEQARPALIARPPPRADYDGHHLPPEHRRNLAVGAPRDLMQRPQTAHPAPASFGRPMNFPLASPAAPAFRPSPMRIATSTDGYQPRGGGSIGLAAPDPYAYHRPHSNRPPAFTNEFGMPMLHDTRGASNTGVAPYPQSLRPHTYHDTANVYYRPPPAPRPMEPPENPYTRAMFPASSSRQVSDFQRFGHSALSPGMTVQETIRQQQQRQQSFANHLSQGQGHFGPREPRLSHGTNGHSQATQPMQSQQQYYSQNIGANRDQRTLAHTPALYSPRGQEAQHASVHPHQLHPTQAQTPLTLQHGGHLQGMSNQQQPARPLGGQQQRILTATSPPRAGIAARPSESKIGQTAAQSKVSQSSSATTHISAQNGQHPASLPKSGREGQGWHSAASTSDRSSGSSYVSSGGDSHHRRDHSLEDTFNRSSIEESHTAPTSARSSRSAPLSPDSSRRPDNSSSSDGRWRGSAASSIEPEDIDVAKIRPLPKLPSSSSAQASPVATPPASSHGLHSGSSEDEGTLKAAKWASLMAQSAGSSDAAKAARTPQPSARSLGINPRASPSEASSSATIKSPGSEEAGRISPDLRTPGNEGTFASFGSFADDDDDDDGGGTWAKPLDAPKDVGTLQASTHLASKGADGDEPEDDAGGTLRANAMSRLSPGMSTTRVASPRRPELRLTIDSPSNTSMSPGTSAVRGVLPSSRGPLHPATGSGGDDATILPGGQPQLSPALHRRSSFARSTGDDWVLRPPPEQLYENLDEFFPKHDLDKPVLETPGGPGSPMTSASPRLEGSSNGHAAAHSNVAPISPSSAASLARHKKSIRRVAEDRRKIMERNEPGMATRPSVLGTALSGLTPSNVNQVTEGDNLARRRSTKLWGTKLLEMTPGQEQVAASPAHPAESPSADSSSSATSSARPVFKWVKGDLIGKGTYGRVYIALNATTGEMIAVKQVERPRTDSDREDARQKGVVAALKSEIDTLKDLDHPNIVSYLGFEETSKFLHLFLEYVPGGSIASVLRKYGKLEETTIKFFVNQVLSGLSYLHERGVLHRDLKGDNLLVSLDGTVKISDFGTVRRSDDIYNNVEGMSLQGSVFWMAPEVVSLSKKGYSAKVDIWSLGCVVLEMFAGRRPWSDDEAIQAMFKIGKEGRAPPVPPDVRLSQEATHFLKCCFQLDPSCRPTASRLLEHVFPFVGEEWNFESSRLYRTMRRSLQNRNSTTAGAASRS